MKRDKTSARNVTKSLLREYASKRLVLQGMRGESLGAYEIADVTENVTTAAENVTNKHGAELTEQEASLLDDPLDPRAAFSAVRAERWLASIRHDREQEQAWTVNEVKWRLKEAARIGERVIRRDGPSEKTGFWPDPNVFGNVDKFDENCRYEGSRDGTREPDALMRSVAVSASEVEISRVEQAIGWPMRYLGDARFGRECLVLQSWLKACAFREPWRYWMIEPERTSHRIRWNAFVIITCGLIRDNARVI
jgi:hypothetical protein